MAKKTAPKPLPRTAATPRAAQKTEAQMNAPSPSNPRRTTTGQEVTDADQINQPSNVQNLLDPVSTVSTPIVPGTGSGDAPARIGTGTEERAVAKTQARPRAVVAEGEERDLGPLITVRATRMGFVDNVRRREGDVFDVHTAEFSDRWMEEVDGNTPRKITTGKQELERKHDEELKAKVARSADRDPLGAENTSRRA